jgi:regulator of replication initiation timing
MAEHKVALDRVVETIQDYISDEDYAVAASSKVAEASKQIDELKGKMRILEARNVRMDIENKKLEEQVREAAEIISESTKNEKNERAGKAKNVQGRGRSHTGDTEVIAEYHNKDAAAKAAAKETVGTIVEGFDPAQLRAMQVLAGTRQND